MGQQNMRIKNAARPAVPIAIGALVLILAYFLLVEFGVIGDAFTPTSVSTGDVTTSTEMPVAVSSDAGSRLSVGMTYEQAKDAMGGIAGEVTTTTYNDAAATVYTWGITNDPDKTISIVCDQNGVVEEVIDETTT